MKISEVIPYVLTEELEKEFFFSQWEYSNRKICVVKIICDNGLIGWGEAYGPAPVVKECIEYIKQNIIGMNPLESDVIWSTLFRRVHDYGRSGVFLSAISAIDVAIWDIKGKYHKLPISTLLGGSHRDKIRPYATGLYFSNSTYLYLFSSSTLYFSNSDYLYISSSSSLYFSNSAYLYLSSSSRIKL